MKIFWKNESNQIGKDHFSIVVGQNLQPGCFFIYFFNLFVEIALSTFIVVRKNDIQEVSWLNCVEFVQIFMIWFQTIDITKRSRSKDLSSLGVNIILYVSEVVGLHFSLEEVVDHFHSRMVVKFHSPSQRNVVERNPERIWIKQTPDANTFLDVFGLGIKVQFININQAKTLANLIFFAMLLKAEFRWIVIDHFDGSFNNFLKDISLGFSYMHKCNQL